MYFALHFNSLGMEHFGAQAVEAAEEVALFLLEVATNQHMVLPIIHAQKILALRKKLDSGVLILPSRKILGQ